MFSNFVKNTTATSKTWAVPLTLPSALTGPSPDSVVISARCDSGVSAQVRLFNADGSSLLLGTPSTCSGSSTNLNFASQNLTGSGYSGVVAFGVPAGKTVYSAGIREASL